MKNKFDYINVEFDLYENDDDTYHFCIKLWYKNDKDTVEYLIPINTSITINSILNFDDIYLVAGNDFNNHEKIEIKNIILDNDEWIEYINNCLEKAKK